jgi:hypothetical protein
MGTAILAGENRYFDREGTMKAPRRWIVRFATAVVASELARAGSPADAAGVAQRIAGKLRGSVGRLVGPIGFEVLLARSLVRARRMTPVLAGVTVGPGGALFGLGTGDQEATRTQAVALLSNFIELVAILVGEDLLLRFVRRGWSEVCDGNLPGMQP